MATITITEPTPMMTPSMVRAERSLFMRRLSSAVSRQYQKFTSASSVPVAPVVAEIDVDGFARRAVIGVRPDFVARVQAGGYLHEIVAAQTQRDGPRRRAFRRLAVLYGGD